MQQSFWINPLTGEQIFLPAGWRVKAKIPGARWAVYKKRQLQFYFGIETDYSLFDYPSFWGKEWFYLWLFPPEENDFHDNYYNETYGYDLSRRLPLPWKKARLCGYPFYKADGAAIKDKSDRFIHYSYNIWLVMPIRPLGRRHYVCDVDPVNFYFQLRVKAKRTKESRDLCRRIIENFLYRGHVYHLLPGRIWMNPLQEKPVYIPDGWKVWRGRLLFKVDDSFREYRLRKERYNFYMTSYYNWGWALNNDEWLESSDAYGPAVLEHAQWKQEEFAGKPVEISRFAASIATGEAVEGYIICRFKGRFKWALKVWGPKGICEDSEVRRLAEDLSATSMPD